MLNPREVRLLEFLINSDKVIIKDLREDIGALNPAQVKMTLMRKTDLDIHTGYLDVFDRDGKVCHPGHYSLTFEEKQKAHEVLKKEKAERKGSSLSAFIKKNKSNQNNTKGGENEQPS